MNKAIQYFPQNPTDGNTGAEEVAAVKSNWSIEYNDVRVPYKIGKGFYLSVEDVPTTDGTETAWYVFRKQTRSMRMRPNPLCEVVRDWTKLIPANW